MASKIFSISNCFKLLQNHIPGQLVMQMTNHCNADCPQCGMRKSNRDIKRVTLDREIVLKSIEKAAKEGFQAISFTGGEPFLFFEDLLSYIRCASENGIPLIRTGTNGFMFRDSDKPGFMDKVEKIARELAETKVRNIWISIDSSDPQTHEEMRGLQGVIAGIKKALPVFHAYGIYPAANLGINRNIVGKGNDQLKPTVENLSGGLYQSFKAGFSRFFAFVAELGFTTVNACYPMSSDCDTAYNPVYRAASSDSIVTFDRQEKAELFKALMDVIPEYRHKIRIFTPRVSLYNFYREYSENKEYTAPCRGGTDFFYISSENGNAFPCGYRGNENLGSFQDMTFPVRKKAECRLCDWECFRDPGETVHPLLEMVHHFPAFMSRVFRDQEYWRIWKEDMRYYKECGYFDGRKPPKFR